MNRDKVLELAREAGLFSTEVPVLMPKLERFAALIEAEMCKHQADKFCETHCSWTDHHVDCDQVRWDAEPVARLRFYKGEVVVTKDYETVERNGEFDVYTHPAPAVVRQLVDALRMVMDDSDALDGRPRTYECVQEALAAVKEVGL